ncbi:MAG: hypothetical protein O7C75_04815 [Verrucomicrobia bacterium]|nr:hypothetical protein [Verrucomicrobiota bacterium]
MRENNSGKIVEFGPVPWSRPEILECLEEFSRLYEERPIRDNRGGMKAPHMFAVWFMVRQLSPDIIVESGVWKGQSTWLLEKACPKAELFSIDLNLKTREYVSNRAIYSDKDFSEQDWSDLPDQSLVFFDDHQNAYRRLQQCSWFGFRHIIFEDNYPITKGDCYSLKKVFSEVGFDPFGSNKEPKDDGYLFKGRRRSDGSIEVTPLTLTPQYESKIIAPNVCDAKMLRKRLEVYHEFPPVFKCDKTRWEDDWSDALYPTPKPLIERSTLATHDIFLEEAIYYTWICYVRLKSIG